MESVTRTRESVTIAQSINGLTFRNADTNTPVETALDTIASAKFPQFLQIDGSDDSILSEITTLQMNPIILKFQQCTITVRLLETVSHQITSKSKLHRLICRDCTIDNDVTLKTVFTLFPTINSVIGNNIKLNSTWIKDLVQLGVKNLIRLEVKGHLEDAHLWGLNHLDKFYRAQYPGFILALQLVKIPSKTEITEKMSTLLPNTFHSEEFSESKLSSVLRINDDIYYAYNPHCL